MQIFFSFERGLGITSNNPKSSRQHHQRFIKINPNCCFLQIIGHKDRRDPDVYTTKMGLIVFFSVFEGKI